MAKDPAFLFYPGDYLRDTQCLSDKAQVAYDRIMCEHMRNISLDMINITVSQERVNFFIKRLSYDEKEEIFHVLKKIDGNYQIEWVAESICKRKSYSDSRAKNRSKNQVEDMKTYDNHMENENENTINKILKVKNSENGKSKKEFINFKAQPEELLAERYRRHEEAVIANGKQNN